MRTLLLLRHAKSSWKDSALPDHERPLNKRGLNDAPVVGSLIQEQDLLPDLVLCSTAVRARETARLVLEAANFQGEIQFREDLYAFEPGAYLNAISRLDDRYLRVMVVGHNPALEELLAGITGAYQPLPTAALVQLDLSIDHWKEISFGMRARVRNLWRPKESKK